MRRSSYRSALTWRGRICKGLSGWAGKTLHTAEPVEADRTGSFSQLIGGDHSARDRSQRRGLTQLATCCSEAAGDLAGATAGIIWGGKIAR